MHRKSRIVGTVEEVHKAGDNYCQDRLNKIQTGKERYASELKQKARCVSHVHSCGRPYMSHRANLWYNRMRVCGRV